MTTKDYNIDKPKKKPSFDPNKSYEDVQEEKPSFDPNAEFESVEEPVKKKEPTNPFARAASLVSKSGGIHGSAAGQSGKKPTAKAAAGLGEYFNNEPIDHVALNQKKDLQADPLRSLYESHMVDAKNAQQAYAARKAVEANIPDGFESKKILETNVFPGDDNLTRKELQKKAGKYESVVAGLRNIPAPPSTATSPNAAWYEINTMPVIEREAVKAYYNNFPEFQKEVAAAGRDINDQYIADLLPNAKTGQILNWYLNQPEIRTFLEKENPGILLSLQHAYDFNISKNKDFGISTVANEVSRELQKTGINSTDPIFNFYGKHHKGLANQIAERIYQDQPEKLKIWNDYIRDNQERYMDAPSFFEGFASAGKEFFGGVKNTFTEPFTPVSETQRKNWEKEAMHVSADPEGLSKFMRDAGHATGLVASIYGSGNVLGGAGVGNPKTASAIATSLGFFGDQLEQGKLKYPNNPVKATTSAIFNTGLYAALSYDIFPKVKAIANIQKVKPEVEEVVKKLASGEITREAAKQEVNTIFKKIVDTVGGALKTNTKVAAEMTGITILNNLLDRTMGLDQESFEKWHPEDELSETFTSMFLSNSPIALMSGYGAMKRGNKLAEAALYEAASNPLRYQRVLEEMKIKDPSINTAEMAANLKFVTDLKGELDKNGVKPKNQQRFLFEALKNKIGKENAEKLPESNITRSIKEDIKRSQEVQDQILEGKEVEEIVTSDEQKILDENQKARTEIERLTQQQFLDNKEFDVKAQELDKESPTYAVKKEKLELQRKEKNEDYEKKIKDLSETIKVEEKYLDEDSQSLLTSVKEKSAEFEKGENLQYFIDKAAEAPAQYYEKYGKRLTNKLLEYTSTEKLAENYDHIAQNYGSENPSAVALDEIIAKRESDSQKTQASVIMPEENIKPNIIEPVTNEAISETNTENQQGAQPAKESQQPTEPIAETSEPTGQEPPPASPGNIYAERPGTVLSFRGLQDVANEFGLENVKSRDRVSDIQQLQNARETMQEWADQGVYKQKIQELLSDIENKDLVPTDKQRLILQQHLANEIGKLRDIQNKNSIEWDTQFRIVKKIKEIGKIARSEAGAALRIGDQRSHPINSIEDAYVAMAESSGTDVLTDKQKADVEKLVTEYESRAKDAEQKYNDLQAKFDEMLAQQAIGKSSSKSKGVKKTKEQFSEERKQIVADIREKLKKSRQDTSVTIVPYAKELIAIAPDVAKLVSNLVEQGITELGKVIDEIHSSLVPEIPDIKKEDVLGIIGGKYSEPKKPLSDLQKTVRDLKEEARLMIRLEELLSGAEPKEEKKKIERNRNIKQLRDKIKEFKKDKKDGELFYKEEIDTDVQRLKNYIKRVESQTKEIQDKIEKGDFEKEKRVPLFENKELKKKYPTLHKQALDAIVKREEAKLDFDNALTKAELAKRTKTQKYIDIGRAIVATGKAVRAGIDLSASLIQNNVAVLSNPKEGGKAFGKSLADMFSEKRFKRELAKLHENKEWWDLAEKSGLDITDPNSLKEGSKEESFDLNLLNKDIIIKGKKYNIGKYSTKPFERAFTSMGNNLRVSLFNKMVEQLTDKGFTFENNPQAYKDAATVANTMTGRGKLPEAIQRNRNFWSTFIWSPGLMASRFNILGLGDLGAAVARGQKGFYGKMTPEIREYTQKKVAQWVVSQLTIMAAAAAIGYDVDDDPNSSGFGGIKVGDKSYDFSGQHGSYLRFFAQMAKGTKVQDGEEKKISARDMAMLAPKFFRGRLTPFFGSVVDVATGYDYGGDPTTLENVLKNNTIPLSMSNVVKDIQRDAPEKALLNTGVGMLGVKVSDKRDFEENKKTLTIKDPETFKEREATKEEMEKYNKRKAERETEILQSFDSGDEILYVDVNGKLHLGQSTSVSPAEFDTWTEISPKKLNEEQQKKYKQAVAAKAGRDAKKELFGDEN